MSLTLQIHQFVIFVPGRTGPVVDIRALRHISGLALDVVDDPTYQHFLDCYGGFLPVQFLTAWLRLERPHLELASHDQLKALIEPIQQFAAALKPPTAFGSTTYRRATQTERSQLGTTLVRQRWSSRSKRVTPGTVRVIHASMAAGASLGEAAKQAGIAASTAAHLRIRSYPAWNADLEAAWQETFGARPIAQPVRGGWPMRPETRARRDRDRATLLRRVHNLLERDALTGAGCTQKEAAAALGLTRSQIGKLIGQDPSIWGPECALAWSETFGRLPQAQEGQI